MFLGTGTEGGSERQRDMPKSFTTEELKTSEEIKRAIDEIGGENLLKEGEVEYAAHKGEWVEHVQSEIIDQRGIAIAIKEGGQFIGFALITHEGEVKQLRAAPGKEREVLEQAGKKAKDKDIVRLTITISEKAEHLQSILRSTSFEGQKDGEKFKFEKSL